MSIHRIAVLGAGTMGNGIAHVAAQHGREVRLLDVSPQALESATATIAKNLARQVEKEILDESARHSRGGREQPAGTRAHPWAGAPRAGHSVRTRLRDQRRWVHQRVWRTEGLDRGSQQMEGRGDLRHFSPHLRACQGRRDASRRRGQQGCGGAHLGSKASATDIPYVMDTPPVMDSRS